MAFKNSTKSLIEKMDNLLTSYDRRFFPNFGEILRNNFLDEEISRLVEYYSYCDCCDRHQVDKPDILEVYVVIKEAENIKPLKKNCKCYCRHINRTMCSCIKGYKYL